MNTYQRQLLYLVLSLLFAIGVYAQPGIAWQDLEDNGVSGWTSGKNFFNDPFDGNTIFYYSNEDVASELSLFVQKRNPVNGQIIWDNTFGGPGADFSVFHNTGLQADLYETIFMLQTQDGHYLFVGITDSSGGDVSGYHPGRRYYENGLGGMTLLRTQDIWVIKIDALTGDIIWSRCLGGPGDERPVGIIECSNGNFAVVGVTDSLGGDIDKHEGDWDFFITYLNPTNGNILWAKALGGFGDDYAYAVLETGDQQLLVYGSSDSSGGDITGHHGEADLVLLKLDTADGSIIWQSCYGGPGNEEIPIGILEKWGAFVPNKYFFKQTDDNFILVSTTDSSGGDVSGYHLGYYEVIIDLFGGLFDTLRTQDIWAIKIDYSNGDTIWTKTIGGPGNEFFHTALLNYNEDITILTTTDSSGGDVFGHHGKEDIFVARLDGMSGNLKWAKPLGGSLDDEGFVLHQESNHDIVIAGRTFSPDGDVSNYHFTPGEDEGHPWGGDFWLIKMDSSGNLVWNKALGGDRTEEFFHFEAICNGSYLLSGDSYTADGSGDVTLHSPCEGAITTCENLWTVKVDSNGDVLWDRLFSSSDHDENFYGHLTQKGYLLIGYARNAGIAGDKNISGTGSWLLKIALQPAFDADSIVCAGDTVQFIDASGEGQAWIWDFGDGTSISTLQNPKHIYTYSDTFIVTLIVMQECDWDTIQHSIVVYPDELDLGADTTICPGDTLILDAGVGLAYRWEKEDTFLQDTSRLLIVIGEGKYQVEVNNTACFLYDSIEVEMYPFNGYAYGDTIINEGESTVIFAVGGNNYLWSPEAGLSCLNCSSPVATPENTTLYYVYITDSNGCDIYDSVLINISFDAYIQLPLAFSPNGDGKNDVFQLIHHRIKSVTTYTITNRWGQIVFTSNNIDDSWDGTYEGKDQDNGQYIVDYEVITEKDEVIKLQSLLTLIR